ncbi:MAG: hypothetical protein HY907_01735 [Deltaproteobacteria bacterium]|nr:hypothetical protein [Deltaproteobacteria bacterium]
MGTPTDRDLACYEQNAEFARLLNQIIWQIPVLAITLTGGLWYAVASLDGLRDGVRQLLLAFGAVVDVVLILVLHRMRRVLAGYLQRLKEFNPRSYAEAAPIVRVQVDTRTRNRLIDAALGAVCRGCPPAPTDPKLRKSMGQALDRALDAVVVDCMAERLASSRCVRGSYEEYREVLEGVVAQAVSPSKGGVFTRKKVVVWSFTGVLALAAALGAIGAIFLRDFAGKTPSPESIVRFAGCACGTVTGTGEPSGPTESATSRQRPSATTAGGTGGGSPPSTEDRDRPVDDAGSGGD